ncbi:hypothetical protein MED297_10801 [Reinekea sp. MED297]|uniref:SPOR domain-containing protein n=2 Tax=Reinekea TaxID=230494 RepID=A4BAN8_9GAMM|nr:hypothetical protein MED297_10801 [Reinekea sp. MED297] [Reinekea blandensis MED297]
MQSYYNLAHDPFGAIVDAMVFSGAGGRYETAETLRHLLAYSQQDSQLEGPAGSGKRMLAQQVIKMLDESWRVAWVDAADLDSPKALEKEIIGQLGLGLKVEDDTATLLKRINAVIAQRYADEESFLLVVQRADQARPEVEQLLDALRVQAEDADHRIRQLWLVENADAVSDEGDTDWYRHPLEPFTDADAEQYIRDRMIASGYVDDLPIPFTDIARLNQLSGGIPLQLNDMVRDYLISSTFRTTEKKQAFPLTHVIAGVAALTLVTVAFLYQTGESGDNQPVRQADSGSTETDRPLTSVEQRLADAVAQVEARQSGSESVTAEVEATEASTVSSDSTGSESEPSESVALPSSTEGSPTAEESRPTQNAEVPSLLDRGDDAQYTVQLIGVRDQAQLASLLAEFNSPLDVDIVETTYQGDPWFVLIYGQFDTRDEAQSAFEALPEGLFSGDPWIRSFQSLRSSL